LTSRHFKWARIATVLVSVGVFTWVLASAFRQGFELPSGLGLRFVVALPFSVLGLVCGGMSWALLAGGSKRHGFAAFGSSLPLRHLPLGGFGQIAGMAGLTATSGVSRRRAAQAGPLFLLLTAFGASLAAAPILWASEAPPFLRIGVGVAIGLSVAVMIGGRRVLKVLGGRFSIASGSEGIPLAGPIIWSALAAVGAGMAFTILIQGRIDIIAGIGGFSAAWLSGFLFVIAPAGLGAREAVLVTLWPGVDAALVVSVSLIHRLSTLLAEGSLLVLGLALSKGATGGAEGESG
jgi:hypothetical protein